MTKLLDTLLSLDKGAFVTVHCSEISLVKQGTNSHSHNVIIVLLLSIALNQI